MGQIIVGKVRGLSFLVKASLIVTVTALVTVFMYQGWYQPKRAQAVSVTYNTQSTTAATNVATGISADCACGTAASLKNSQLVITLMSTSAQTCASSSSTRTTSTGTLLEAYFNTPYATSTAVTGTSYMIRLKDGNSGGYTAQIQLFHVTAAGVKTNFTGTVASQAVASGVSADYTINLSGQSATIPAGSKLGIRVTAASGSSTSKGAFWGATANAAGNGPSGVLIVSETPVDTVPPTVTAFTMPASAPSAVNVAISTYTATDAVGVTGYMVTESATAPAPGDAGWLGTKPTTFTFSGTGTKTAYAWAKDAAGNVSTSRSATVNIAASSDVTPPVVTFTMPATSTSQSVTPTSFSATDVGGDGVNGYMITESPSPPSPTDPGWSPTPQTSFTFGGAGTRTAYGYAKDAAGNVSAGVPADITITVPVTVIGNGTTPVVNIGINASGPETKLDAFDLSVTEGSSDSISRITVTVSDASPIASVRISNGDNTVTYGSSSVPTGTDYVINLSQNMTAPLGTPAEYLVWVTPKSLATIPGTPGTSYPVTGQVTSINLHTLTNPVNPQDINSATVTITNPTDSVKPTVTAFVMPTSSLIRTVPVTTFTATDNIGITGYMVNEDPLAPNAADARWTSTAPTSYRFAGTASRTAVAYAWAKDGAGNVSLSLNRSVILTLPPPQSPMAHSSGNLTETYGSWGLDYNCATCHVNSGMDTTNIKKVRTSIVTPTGPRPVAFSVISASPANGTANSFGNDLRTDQSKSTNVCEVCHHNTKFHQYSASKITLPVDPYKNHNYSNNGDCQVCHSHNEGFKFSNGSCDNCHGYPPIDSNVGTKTGLATPATNALGATPANASSHNVHVAIRSMNCDTCHSDYLSEPMPNNAIQIGFAINGTNYPGFVGSVNGGTFNGYSSLNDPYVYASTDGGVTAIVKQKGISTCNVYCHGSWNGKTPPAWTATSQTACGSCHGDTTDPPTTGSHIRHFAANGAALNCSKCHTNNTDSSHLNGDVAWDFAGISPSATYKKAGASSGTNSGSTGGTAPSASYGTCANISCHGAGVPTWGANTSTPACEKCHGSATTNPFYDTAGNTTVTSLRTGAHTVHLLATTAGRNISANVSCQTCHTVPATAGTFGHFDTYPSAEVTITGTLATKNGTLVPGYNYSSRICSNVYCHGAGLSGGDKTPTWNTDLLTGNTTASGDCSKCHAYLPPPQAIGDHLNVSAATACKGCHDHVDTAGTGFATPALHMDGIIQAAGGSDCSSCHNKQQPTTAPYRRQVFSITATRAEFSVTGALTNMSSHVRSGNVSSLTCEICHAQTSHKTYTNGVNVLLKNTRVATGTLVYNGTATSLTNFCIGCHKSGGNSNTSKPTGSVATATAPYADSGNNNAPKNVFAEWSSANQWSGTSTATQPKMTHRKVAECADCHGNAGGKVGDTLNPRLNLHASTNGAFLQYSGTVRGREAATCLNRLTGCHGPASNIFAGARVYNEFVINKSSSGTGGAHPILASVVAKSTRISGDNAGANFVRGWKGNSVATCSDCHGGSATGPRGPHGSTRPFLIRALDTTSVAKHTDNSTIASYPATPNPKTFCLNCHAADVYGDGNGGVGTNGGTRFGHGSGSAWNGTGNCGSPDASPLVGTGCQNCHCGKGTLNGTPGTHSTTAGVGSSLQSGVGFTNGNCWTAPPGNVARSGCYAGGGSLPWNTCSKGGHN